MQDTGLQDLVCNSVGSFSETPLCLWRLATFGWDAVHLFLTPSFSTHKVANDFSPNDNPPTP